MEICYDIVNYFQGPMQVIVDGQLLLLDLWNSTIITCTDTSTHTQASWTRLLSYLYICECVGLCPGVCMRVGLHAFVL